MCRQCRTQTILRSNECNKHFVLWQDFRLFAMPPRWGTLYESCRLRCRGFHIRVRTCGNYCNAKTQFRTQQFGTGNIHAINILDTLKHAHAGNQPFNHGVRAKGSYRWRRNNAQTRPQRMHMWNLLGGLTRMMFTHAEAGTRRDGFKFFYRAEKR